MYSRSSVGLRPDRSRRSLVSRAPRRSGLWARRRRRRTRGYPQSRPPGRHRNGNSLDNRKCNLRLCTYGQNNRNRRPRGRTSRFKCVTYDAKRNQYRAAAWHNGKSVHVGRYDDELEAARAGDYANVELNGEYAYLNFPEEWPEERIRAVHEAAQARKLGHKERVTSDRQDHPLKATAERIAKKIMETPPDRKAKKLTAEGEKKKGRKPKRHDS
jgi:hypothetical protein